MANRFQVATIDADEIPVAKLIYLAGMLDADGTIAPVVRGRYTVYRLAVYNNSLKLMAWLVRWIGGKYYPVTRRPRLDFNTQSGYMWQLGRQVDIMDLLSVLYPYLVVKRSAAAIAIEGIRNRCSVQSKVVLAEGVEQ